MNCYIIFSSIANFASPQEFMLSSQRLSNNPPVACTCEWSCNLCSTAKFTSRQELCYRAKDYLTAPQWFFACVPCHSKVLLLPLKLPSQYAFHCCLIKNLARKIQLGQRLDEGKKSAAYSFSTCDVHQQYYLLSCASSRRLVIFLHLDSLTRMILFR